MSDSSFEPFACAPGMRLQAHERLSEVHFAQIREHLLRVEELLAKLERRLWVSVYGVAAVIIAQAVQQLVG